MIRHRTESLQRFLEAQWQNPGWIIFITERIPSSKIRRGSIDIGDVRYKQVTSLHECSFLRNNIWELNRADCTAKYN